MMRIKSLILILSFIQLNQAAVLLCDLPLSMIDQWEVEGYNTAAQEALDEKITSEPEEPSAVLRLDLETGMRLALSTERRMGGAIANVTIADLNLELLESDFDLQIIPRGDTGYVGGGRAGSGVTVGGGIDLYKRFPCGTKVSIQPSLMKAANDYQTNLRIRITQPLLRGFGKEYNFAGIYAAQYASRNARRALYQTQIHQILRVVQGLYEVIKQEQLVKVDNETQERMKKFCVSVKVKEKINLCDSLDVYRAETELKNAEDSFNQSSERLQEAKDNLRDTLALPLDMDIQVDVPIEYNPITLSLEEALEIALQNRIELDRAADRLQDTRRLLRLEKENQWPDLNFTADYSSFICDEVFTSVWTDKRESKWGFGFTTSGVPKNNNFEQCLLSLREAERNIEQVRDDIILEVKRTLRILQRASDRIILQDEQINNAQKEYHLARLKFEHGLASNFDLIQAEKNLRAAQTSLIGAIIEHRVTEFRLLSVLGTLTDKPGCYNDY